MDYSNTVSQADCYWHPNAGRYSSQEELALQEAMLALRSLIRVWVGRRLARGTLSPYSVPAC